jgi:hypothetical protein
MSEEMEIIMLEKYYSEFEIIDGFNMHRDGLSFYTWLKYNYKPKDDE